MVTYHEGMSQTDSPDVDLPEVIDLLCRLQETGSSIYLQRAINNLTITPAPDGDLLNSVETHYAELKALLPGYCDGCGEWALRRIESYWGAHPHLCGLCRQRAVMIFDRNDKWPPTTVPDRP